MNADTASRTDAPEPNDGVIPELLPLELQTLSLLLTTGVSLDDLPQEWAALLTTRQLVRARCDS